MHSIILTSLFILLINQVNGQNCSTIRDNCSLCLASTGKKLIEECVLMSRMCILCITNRDWMFSFIFRTILSFIWRCFKRLWYSYTNYSLFRHNLRRYGNSVWTLLRLQFMSTRCRLLLVFDFFCRYQKSYFCVVKIRRVLFQLDIRKHNLLSITRSMETDLRQHKRHHYIFNHRHLYRCRNDYCVTRFLFFLNSY